MAVEKYIPNTKMLPLLTKKGGITCTSMHVTLEINSNVPMCFVNTYDCHVHYQRQRTHFVGFSCSLDNKICEILYC